MGTEVLYPQDCLVHHRIRVAPVVFPRRRTYGNSQQQGGRPNNNGNHAAGGNRRVQVRPEQRRKSPDQPRPRRSASVGDLKERSVGQVTILRRGESIEWKSDQVTSGRNNGGGDDGANSLSGTRRVGPDPEMVAKHIRMSSTAVAGDTYAGSAFSMSPSPRALPLPSFFNRKSSLITQDDYATKDLRRLLRLE